MFKQLGKILHSELSENNALLHAHEINKIDRRFSYDNFRKSADYCARALSEIGAAEVEVIPHPADGVTTYMDCVMPMAWDVRKARLEIAVPVGSNPKVLADWKENPFTIGMWSPPTKPGGDEAEVVPEEDMWTGADVRGKIVLNSTIHHPRTIKKEVAKRGGIGVISDWTENYLDTPDGIYWNNEWSQTVGGWYGGTKEDAEQSPIWCISITPRTGLYLRKLMSNKKTPVRLRATIDTRLYEGTINTITGIIPGKSKHASEVLMLAHLYEPMPADNAAGAGATLEILRAIKSLIDQGRLLQPEKTIRILLSQELYGFSAYLATHSDVRSRVIAALNIDDICFDQKRSGLPVSVITNPDAQASFTDVLFTDIARHCFTTYAPLLTWKTRRGNGSDDTFVSDPTIGISANWVISNSGRYHHNSMNNFSCLDPEMLRVNMMINATFAYFVASAGVREAAWLGSHIASEARKKMIEEVENKLAPCLLENDPDIGKAFENLRRRLDYLKFVEINRLVSLKNIAGSQDCNISNRIVRLSQEIERLAPAGMRIAEGRVKALWPDYRKPGMAPARELTNIERVARNIIPERKTMGIPVNYVRVPQEERGKVCSKSTRLGLMWTDGKRDLLEIIRMVENENAMPVTDIKNTISYFTALANYGYLRNRYKVVLHKEGIKKALRRIGVKRNDVVFMHSSLSSAGYIEDGANAVIGALMEVLGPGGTLVMPTNYDNGVIAVTECGLNNPYPPVPPHIPVPWDPAESPAYTGAIPNVFRQRDDVLRSKHPTHSVAAWGKLAEEFIKGHEPGTSGCGREGPCGKMVDYDGKFLYFACSINSTTFWHALEDWLDLPYLPTADVLMKLDDRVVVVKAPKYPEGHRSFYASIPHKISKQMEETGVELKQVPLGLSDLRLVRARDYYDKLFPAFRKEADLFLCDREGCPFCTWARKQIAREGRWPMKIGIQTGGNDSVV